MAPLLQRRETCLGLALSGGCTLSLDILSLARSSFGVRVHAVKASDEILSPEAACGPSVRCTSHLCSLRLSGRALPALL